jgi:polysaccharide pyruvyl transferase WcaK-like protein
MSQFYIASEPDADRCRRSQISRTVITISGLNLKGKVQSFTGVVQSVDDDTKRHVQKRWRITMRNSN